MHLRQRRRGGPVKIGLLALLAGSAVAPLAAQTLPGNRSAASPAVSREIQSLDSELDKLARETGVELSKLKRIVASIQKNDKKQGTAIASNEAGIASLTDTVRQWVDRITAVESALAKGSPVQGDGTAFLTAIDQGRLDEAAKFYAEFERASVRAYYRDNWATIVSDADKADPAASDATIARLEQYISFYPAPDNVDEARALHAKLTSARDEAARLRKLRTPWLAGNRQMALPAFGNIVTAVSFSPDMKLLAVAEADGQVSLVDTGNWRTRTRIKAHDGTVTSLHFSSDSRYLLTAGEDRLARSWLTSSGRKVQEFAGHGERVNSARFSPDNRLVLTASSDEKIMLWNPDNGALVKTLVDESECKRLERVEAGNLRRNDGCRFMDWHEPRYFADFSADGSRILVQSRSFAGQYEYPSGAIAGRPAAATTFAHKTVGPHRYAANADIYFSRGNGSNMGSLIDGATNRERCSLPSSGGYGTTAISADFARNAKLVAVGTSNNAVVLFNSGNCTPLAELTGFGLPVDHVSLAADGRSVAAAAGTRVMLWFDLSQPDAISTGATETALRAD